MSTKFILIRHGEPRFDEVVDRGYHGMGYEIRRLTDLGIEQALNVTKDPLLKDAEVIVSSPYTRALQTAAIISRRLDLPLIVENDIHEWMPDTTFRYEDNFDAIFSEYLLSKGVRKPTTVYHWESYEALKKRVQLTLLKYKNYKKVIVVCHGIVISTLTHFNDVIEHCGIREVKL